MVWKKILFIPVFTLAACSTLKDSLELGAGLGALGGGLATYAGHSSAGHHPSGGALTLGAGLGLGLGTLTAYLVHRSVEANRADSEAEQTEMHFGDLPPSPFVFPKITRKRGTR